MNLLHAALERVQRETNHANSLAKRAPNLMSVTQEVEVAGGRIRQGLVNLVNEEIEKLTTDVTSNTSTIATIAQTLVDTVSKIRAYFDMSHFRYLNQSSC